MPHTPAFRVMEGRLSLNLTNAIPAKKLFTKKILFLRMTNREPVDRSLKRMGQDSPRFLRLDWRV